MNNGFMRSQSPRASRQRSQRPGLGETVRIPNVDDAAFNFNIGFGLTGCRVRTSARTLPSGHFTQIRGGILPQAGLQLIRTRYNAVAVL
jgi:hypothetical protein